MYVGLFTKTLAALRPYLFPEVQERVYNRCRNACEAKPVAQREGRRKEKGAVIRIRFGVEGAACYTAVCMEILLQNTRDVIHRAGIVVARTAADGHVLRVPGVGVIQNRRHDPEEKDESRCNVCFRPPRSSDRRTNVRNLRPIERDERHP